ncbi:hypothetical protein [Kitasatospora cheerisanensis]|uniref:Uncharacterized protein n=1 Tax=Kitasatospora cheerisanensis KCTC 2395 TaxID=1348663 RepID=A0A066YY37_9ACTN|nr:hypothetical protein [Kitasatospora cheerisanensis]KDN86137.1 hypothetical protein KCH_19540 [Kitasatospora cheerisanensis KCTC 2395]
MNLAGGEPGTDQNFTPEVEVPVLPVPLTGRLFDAAHAITVVALLTPPLLLAAVASLPALLVLPFLPGGDLRAERLMRQLMLWTTRLLDSGRRTGGPA